MKLNIFSLKILIMKDIFFLKNQFLRLSSVIDSIILQHDDEFNNDSETKLKLEHLSDIAKNTASHMLLSIMTLRLHTKCF